MSRTSKAILLIILILALLVLGVGYAAISNIGLNISGQAQAEAEQGNFRVEFIGEPTTTDDSRVTAELDTNDKLKATMNVTGLTAEGETVSATYTIKNLSNGLSAELSADVSKNTNPEYFEVTHDMTETETIATDKTATITVTVKLIRTPIEDDPVKSEIGVEITAKPVQP